jgi:RNA polymerase sigma-70 factor (ECF subfamily)
MPAVPEDAELVSRSKAGELEAFGVLYERYLDPVYRYIRSHVGDRHAAEDLTEMVFLRAFESLGGYQERGWPFSAFLYRIARNQVIDHHRAQRHIVDLEETEGGGAEPIDSDLERREEVQRMRQALSTLPPDYQEVIRLRVLLGLSTSTVAIWLGRSQGATRVLLSRALAELRRRVSELDE